MKLSQAIALSALAALLGAEAAPLPFTQDLQRIAKWVNGAPAKDPLSAVWQRALRELNCSPGGEPTKVPERQVLRCVVDPQRAADMGSVITEVELRTFSDAATYPAQGGVWKQHLSFHFQPSKGPTGGSLADMKFKAMRAIPAPPGLPGHGQSLWAACPIAFDVETVRPTKKLYLSTRQRDGGCTSYADELSFIGVMGKSQP